MSLLFQPEPTDRLRARFQDALTPIYTMDRMKRDLPRPNEQRKHVFDFEDGTRITISHEQLGQRLYLHATCSMDRRCVIRADNFPNVCYVKMCELAGKKLEVAQVDRDDLSQHFLFLPLIDEQQASPTVQP